MKGFLIRCLCFSIPVFASICFVLTLGDGYTDAFYMRFTTPRQNSMILGSSRAAQGVVPAVLDSLLSRKGFFNFAFTIGDSPYGPTYLDAIKKKLAQGTKNGIFIVTIDPWSISSKCAIVNDTTAFRELNGCLAKTENLNSNPNILYLLSTFNKRYINLLIRNPQTFLHGDGWLEVTVNMDSAEVVRRTKNSRANYEGMVQEYCASQARLDYLVKTITFLKRHGDVFMVRLPVHPMLMEVENEFMADFDSTISSAIDASDGYLDLTSMNSSYKYTDGNHLYWESSKAVSREIASWITGNIHNRMTNVNGPSN